MKLLTKAEACRELAVSLSTLDRRIVSGEIEVRREQHGRRHRIYVMLDEPPENGVDAKSQGTLLDVAQERIRGLDEQVELLQAQLKLEQERNAGLEEVYGKERGERDRMRRVAFILGLVAAGLLVVSVLVAWRLLAYGAYMLECGGTAIAPVVGMPVGGRRQLTGVSPMPHYLGKTR